MKELLFNRQVTHAEKNWEIALILPKVTNYKSLRCKQRNATQRKGIWDANIFFARPLVAVFSVELPQAYAIRPKIRILEAVENKSVCKLAIRGSRL